MNDFLYHKKRSLLQDCSLFRTFAIENKTHRKLNLSLQETSIIRNIENKKQNNNANNLKTK